MIFFILLIIITILLYFIFIKPVSFVRNLNTKNKARIRKNEFKQEIQKEEKKLKKK